MGGDQQGHHGAVAVGEAVTDFLSMTFTHRARQIPAERYRDALEDKRKAGLAGQIPRELVHRSFVNQPSRFPESLSGYNPDWRSKYGAVYYSTDHQDDPTRIPLDCWLAFQDSLARFFTGKSALELSEDSEVYLESPFLSLARCSHIQTVLSPDAVAQLSQDMAHAKESGDHIDFLNFLRNIYPDFQHPWNRMWLNLEDNLERTAFRGGIVVLSSR